MVDITKETHEQVVARVGANVAPRITPDRIAAVIVGEAFFRLTETLTVCVLTLANGFTVTGESACASPANYNEEIGNGIARKQAEAKIWALEGYVLREKLALAAAGTPPSTPGMRTYVGFKAVHAMPLTRAEYCAFRGWVVPEDEDGADAGYLVEYADGGPPNLPDYAGYVSWSPKEVFDRSYQLIDAPAPDHKDRMRAELSQLSERISKLGRFVSDNPAFLTLEHGDRELLSAQYAAMVEYELALAARVTALR